MRRATHYSTSILAALTFGAAAPAFAADGDGSTAAAAASQDLSNFRLSAGLDLSEGKYGDTIKTIVYAVPVALKYTKGPFTLKISTSFVHVRGPGSLLTTPEDRTGRAAADATTGGSLSTTTSNSGPGSSGSGSSGSGSSGGGSGSTGSGSGSSGGGGSGSSGGGSGSGSGSGSSGSGNGGSGGGGGSSGGGNSGGSSGSAGTGGGTGSTTAAPVAGTIIPGGANRSQSGIGDTNLSLTYSLGLGANAYLDLSGKVKIPTASVSKRFGTGKVDIVIGAELSKSFGAFDVYGGGRRRFSGSTVANPVRDTWGGSAGFGMRVATGVRVGIDYDWQEAAFAGAIGSSEISGSINIALSRRMRLNLYGLTGTNRASADFGTGAQLTYRF